MFQMHNNTTSHCTIENHFVHLQDIFFPHILLMSCFLNTAVDGFIELVHNTYLLKIYVLYNSEICLKSHTVCIGINKSTSPCC